MREQLMAKLAREEQIAQMSAQKQQAKLQEHKEKVDRQLLAWRQWPPKGGFAEPPDPRKLEPVPVGWALLRFDAATEGRGMALRRQLQPGSLREHLLQPSSTGQRPSDSALADELDSFVKQCRGPQTGRGAGTAVGAIEYEVEALPLPETARRLLPSDFPAVVGARRLGGVRCGWSPSQRLSLSADVDVSCRLRDVRVALPDGGWLSNFLRSIELPAKEKPQAESTGLPAWELQGLHTLVGTHNALRWLNESMQELKRNGSVRLPLDEAGRMWQLEMARQEGGTHWTFSGEAPIEFVYNADCAVVLEVVAVVSLGYGPSAAPASSAGTEPLLGEGASRHPQHTRSLTVGWLLLLPACHVTDEALQQAVVTASGMPGVVYFDLPLRYGPERSLTGQEVWSCKPAQGTQHMPGLVRVSLSLVGDRLVSWLQRIQPHQPPSVLVPAPSQPTVLTPVPTPGAALAPSPAPAPPQPVAATVVSAVQAQSATDDLLSRKPNVEEVEMAKRSQAAPPPLPAPAPQPQQLAKPAIVVPAAHQPAAPSSPPEQQTVVERVIYPVYLRDQGTQSDPPPLQDADDHIIGEGRALGAQPLARRSEAYAGPAMQPLKERDRAELLRELGDTSAGRLLRGLQPSGPMAPARELRWKFEDEDPLQADEVTVEFLALRNASGPLAERVHFQLRFFLFPPVKTAAAPLAGGPGEACLLRSAVTSERLALVFHVDGNAQLALGAPAMEPQAPALRATIGEAGAVAEVHAQLVQHLASRSAQVEVWSADAAMQVGVVMLPLEALVRQGHPVAKLEAEQPVLDPMTGEARGLLRVLLVCRGRPPAKERPQVQAPSPAPRPELGERLHGRRRHKAKALLEASSAPGDASRALLGSATEDPEEASKKQQRLKQLRAMRRVDAASRFSDHTAMLSAAEEVRQGRKREEVARRMDQFNTSHLRLHSPFATPTFFHVEFTNPYNQQATFRITMVERGAQFSSEVDHRRSTPIQGVLPSGPDPALSLVKDPEEWRRLAAARRVPPPPGGDFSMLVAGGGVFMLRAREAVCLPFRYLTFGHPSLAAEPQSAPASGLSLADVVQPGVDRDRSFVIEVCVHQGSVLRRVELTARAQPCVVDRTVRFFEAEGTPLEKTMAFPPPGKGPLHLATGNVLGSSAHALLGGGGALLLPSDLQSDPSSGRFAYCTDKDVHVQRKDHDELVLRLLAPQSPQVRSFFLIFYSDPYFLHVIAVQLIEVQGLRSEHVRVSVGQYVERSICLPPVDVLDAAAVRMYSSHPEMARVPPAADVDARYGAKFTVILTATQLGTKACRLHAVDPATRRHVAALLLVVSADAPEIKMVHDVALPVLTAVRKRLAYKNELTRSMRFSVRSSEPGTVAVQTPDLVIGALDTRYIELLFRACPATLSYSAEAFLFVASEDRTVQETRLLQLSYT